MKVNSPFVSDIGAIDLYQSSHCWTEIGASLKTSLCSRCVSHPGLWWRRVEQRHVGKCWENSETVVGADKTALGCKSSVLPCKDEFRIRYDHVILVLGRASFAPRMIPLCRWDPSDQLLFQSGKIKSVLNLNMQLWKHSETHCSLKTYIPAVVALKTTMSFNHLLIDVLFFFLPRNLPGVNLNVPGMQQ